MPRLTEMAAVGEDFVTCCVRDAGLKVGHARRFQKKLLDSAVEGGVGCEAGASRQAAPTGTCASPVCDAMHADMQQATAAASSEAMQLLRQLEGVCSGSALHCCRTALGHLEGPGPRDAFLAYCAARRATADCAGTDCAPLRAMASKAEHATCDVLTWRCQLRAGLGCRERFLEALRAACLNVVDQDLEERVLHSHSLAVAPHFPSSFLSRNKAAALKRGKPRKKKKRGQTTGLPHRYAGVEWSTGPARDREFAHGPRSAWRTSWSSRFAFRPRDLGPTHRAQNQCCCLNFATGKVCMNLCQRTLVAIATFCCSP